MQRATFRPRSANFLEPFSSWLQLGEFLGELYAEAGNAAMTEFFDKFPYRALDLELHGTLWDGHFEGTRGVTFCRVDELLDLLLKLHGIPDIEGDERRLTAYRRRVNQYINWIRTP